MLRRLLRSNGAIIAYVVIATWALYRIWMELSAPQRVENGLLERAQRDGRISVVVEMPFTAEAFHVDKLQEFGGIRRIDGNMITIRSITAEGIERMAKKYFWIKHIRSVPL